MKEQAIPLKALVRRASRVAEKLFNKQGEFDPFWLVETKEGEQTVVVTPFVADNPLEAFAVKQAVLNNMRRLFAEEKVRRYVIAAECWKSSAGVSRDEEESARRYAELDYTLANAPDREEVVSL